MCLKSFHGFLFGIKYEMSSRPYSTFCAVEQDFFVFEVVLSVRRNSLPKGENVTFHNLVYRDVIQSLELVLPDTCLL